MAKNTFFNGNIPCIAHRAACGLSENIISELVTLSHNLNIPLDKVSLYTVFLYQQKYISKRYTEDELNNILILDNITCNTLRFKYGHKDLCCNCTLSENYSNSNQLEEQNLLSYSCISTSNRNKLSALIKSKSNQVFRAKQRIGNNDTSSKYIGINNIIYKYICSLSIIPKLEENEEMEQLANNFSEYINKEKSLLILDAAEQGYVISYFLSIYSNANKINMTDSDVVDSVNILLSREALPKLIKKKSNDDSENTKLQLSLFDIANDNDFSSNLLETDLKDNINAEEIDTGLLVDNMDKNDEHTNTGTKISNKEKCINFFDRYLQNKLSLSLLMDIANVNFIYDDMALKALDYSILSNNVISIEILQCDDNEYCLLYLFKQNSFYLLNIKDISSLDLIKFYLLNVHTLVKITYSTLLLNTRLNLNLEPKNNVHSLELLYNISNKSETYINYELFIQLLSTSVLNENTPFILQGMTNYKTIFHNLIGDLNSINLNMYNRELLYESIISKSLFANQNNSDKYYLIDIAGLNNGINQYCFNPIPELISNNNNLILSLIIQNTTLDNIVLEDIYKDICIKLYLNNLISKHEIKLLSLTYENGLKLLILKNSYAELFTILNHWTIAIVKKRFQIVPSLYIESLS